MKWSIKIGRIMLEILPKHSPSIKIIGLKLIKVVGWKVGYSSGRKNHARFDLIGARSLKHVLALTFGVGGLFPPPPPPGSPLFACGGEEGGPVDIWQSRLF